MEIKKYLDMNPYGLYKDEKTAIYNTIMQGLTKEHYKNCPEYRKLLDRIHFNVDESHNIEDYPFIPVRLFKEFDLMSVPQKDIVKTMTSSGTSGQRVSRIFLNRNNAANQTVALTKIMSDFTGSHRLPMLVIDSRSAITNRELFSARGAGILGFSMLGHHVTYALDDNMNLNVEKVQEFLEQYKDQEIFLFGFTYILWLHFLKELEKYRDNGICINIDKGILLHGGGFKKLEAEAVDNQTFKNRLRNVCGISRVYNYYGMVEQTGSIFVECESGRLHASLYSDVIIRNPKDFSVCKKGEKGLVQLISMLPESYPGHSILTEDLGEITGEDDCPCGRCGKTIKIYGRIKQAESRGCSDTYSSINNVTAADNDGNESNVNKVSCLAGCLDTTTRCIEPYSDEAVNFINAFSKKLLYDKEASMYPDLMTLAYWCRKSNITRLKMQYEKRQPENEYRLGRGLAFHITPSNVPVNFMFSYMFGLLSGNSNIVRVPGKETIQKTIICRVLNELFNESEFESVKNSTSIISYKKNDNITLNYLGKADVRIVWGGNKTVSHIRSLKSKEKSVEVVFADRYSFAIFSADEISEYLEQQMKDFAHRFYNDTYLMDQNACSSPHLILWKNENMDKSSFKYVKDSFYRALRNELISYRLQPIQMVDKYTLLCQTAISQDHVDRVDCSDPLIYRVKLRSLPNKISVLRGKFGLFYEYDLMSNNELVNRIDSSVQTVVCEGIDRRNFGSWTVKNNLSGIDRIVQTGKSLDIGVYWDGYDIISMMSRGIMFE